MLASQTEIDLGKSKVIAYIDAALDGGFGYRATNYCIVGAGGTLKEARGAACHSGIGFPQVIPRCVSTEFAVRRRYALRDTAKGLLDTYVQYLRDEPLWAPFIVDTFEDGITIDASAPQNVVQALMISSRLCWEASDEAFLLFNNALSKGLHPRLAFNYAFCGNPSYYDYTQAGRDARCPWKDGHVVQSQMGHRPWPMMGGKSLDAFLNGTFKPTRPYAEYQTTSNVYNMFGSVPLIEHLFTLDSFKERLRQHRAGSKEELYAPPNPFAPKPSVKILPSGQISLAEHRTVVLDELVSQYHGQGGLANVA